MTELLELLRCPVCRSRLGPRDGLRCSGCAGRYDVEDGIHRLRGDSLARVTKPGEAVAGLNEGTRALGASSDAPLQRGGA